MQPVLRVIHRAEDGFLIAALLSMLAMALVQILLRNFFDSGLLWAESALRILVLWVAMLGAMVATRESNHIAIDLVTRFLPDYLKKFAILVSYLFSAFICGLVAYHSIELIQFEYEDQTIAFASVPVWMCQSIMPFGFGVMAFRFTFHGVAGLFK
jgi:TRAP-type C4-dicarboxylate transport system permease small subunit